MIITESITTIEECGDVRDRSVTILVNDKQRIRIGEGEPEDMYLFRDLSDAYGILDLLKEVYEVGKKGEVIEFKSVVEED